MTGNPYGVTGPKARGWSLGYHAGRDGMSRAANPYRSGYRRVWELGWEAGMAARKAAGPVELARELR